MLESLFNKVADLPTSRLATLLKESKTQVLFCEYWENIHFEKHLRMDASESK